MWGCPMYITPDIELKHRLIQLESLTALCSTIVGEPRPSQEIWLRERTKHEHDLGQFLLLHRNEIQFMARSVKVNRAAGNPSEAD